MTSLLLIGETLLRIVRTRLQQTARQQPAWKAQDEQTSWSDSFRFCNSGRKASGSPTDMVLYITITLGQCQAQNYACPFLLFRSLQSRCVTAVGPAPVKEINGQDRLINFKDLGDRHLSPHMPMKKMLHIVIFAISTSILLAQQSGNFLDLTTPAPEEPLSGRGIVISLKNVSDRAFELPIGREVPQVTANGRKRRKTLAFLVRALRTTCDRTAVRVVAVTASSESSKNTNVVEAPGAGGSQTVY